MRGILNVGVIGLGMIGSLHARVIHQLPNASLAAVADADPLRAEAVGRQHGCPAYSDYRELLSRDDIDAVAVCVPDTHHLEVSVAAARAGKHVLLEKPLAATSAEGRCIIDAAQAAGIRLMVAHILRFDPRYVQLHDALARGDLGEPVHLRLRRQNPVATVRRLKGSVPILQYLGIHDADLIRWYASSEAERVYAQKVCRLNKDVGVEDAIIALITFENGAIGTLELGWVLPERFPSGIYASAEVVGTRGAGYVNILDQGLCLCTADGIRYPDALHWPEVNGQVVGDLRDEIAHFVDRTLDGRDYAMNAWDALAAVRLIEACAESIARNEPVQLRADG